MKNLRTLLITAAALAILPAAVRANTLTITFDSSLLFVHVGETVTFRGTVTNNDASTVFLNGADVIPSGPFTTDGDALFFANSPVSLDGGFTSDPFDMFFITVNEAYPGPYGLQPSGIFNIRGGVDGADDSLIGQAEFQVDVLSPEPGTFLLLGLAFPAVWAIRRRRA